MPKSRQKKLKAIDPFCTGSRKALLFAKEKEFNRAPKNVSSQEIPRSLKNMMEASKMVEQRQKHTVQKLGSVERRPAESHSKFMKRVGSNAKKKLDEARSKLESDNVLLKGKIHSDEVIRKKKERIAVLQQRIKGRNFERELDNQEKDFFKDRVEFGEVVSAPPILSAKPRKSSSKTDKPGSRHLLLKSMLPQKTSQDDQPTTKKPKRTGRVSQDHTGKIKKRKHMTHAEKRNFDRSRQAAILAYRNAKAHGQDTTVLTRT